MNRDLVERYRCDRCGEIGWTTLAIGCKQCGALELLAFVGPGRYPRFKDTIQECSRNLAVSRPLDDWHRLAAKYAHYGLGQLHNVENGSRVSGDLEERLLTAFRSWSEGGLTAAECLTSYSDWLESITDLDHDAGEQIRSEVLAWAQERGEQFKDDEPQSSFEIPGRSLIRSLLGTGQDAEKLDNATSNLIVDVVRRTVEASGGACRLEAAGLPGYSYAFLPYNYHLSVSKTVWQALGSAVKLVPLVVLLLRQEFSAGAAVGLVAAKEILCNLHKLRIETGEFCVYEAIRTLKNRTGSDPNLSDVVTEIRDHNSMFRYDRSGFQVSCPFMQGSNCRATEGQIEAVLKFLDKKDVISEVRPARWRICF